MIEKNYGMKLECYIWSCQELRVKQNNVSTYSLVTVKSNYLTYKEIQEHNKKPERKH